MKFHDTLNEQIWDLNTEDLIPEVKEKLKEIAEAFIEFLEIPTDAVLDKVITGSSASYNYNEFSDLDLHIIVDYDKVHEDCPLVNGYLNSLKKQFNDNHDITIHGVPVELYAEQKDQGTVHNGLYSLQTGWIDKPQKIEPTDNDAAVEAKFNEIKELVDKCDDSEEATELLEKIYNMRKAGLAEAGEFCTENLAFKKLRNEGCMDKLRQIKKEQIDKQLSLESYTEENESDEDKYLRLCNLRRDVKSGLTNLTNLLSEPNVDVDKINQEIEEEKGHLEFLNKRIAILRNKIDKQLSLESYNEASDEIEFDWDKIINLREQGKIKSIRFGNIEIGDRLLTFNGMYCNGILKVEKKNTTRDSKGNLTYEVIGTREEPVCRDCGCNAYAYGDREFEIVDDDVTQLDIIKDKNESIKEESQLDKEAELAQKLIDTCEQMGFEVVQDRFDWIDLGNGIHIQVWTGSVTVVDYNTGDEKELPLETEEDLQNILNQINELKKNESVDEEKEYENVVIFGAIPFINSKLRDANLLYNTKPYTGKTRKYDGVLVKVPEDDTEGFEMWLQENNFKYADLEDLPKNESVNEQYVNVSSSIYVITDRKLVNEMLEVAKTCKSIYDFEKTEIAKHCELMTKIKRNKFTGVDLEELVDNIRYTYEDAYIDTTLDEWEIEDNKIRTGSILVTSEDDYYYESLNKFHNNIKIALGEEMEERIYNVEFNYEDEKPGLAIGTVKVKATSEQEALDKAEQYAKQKHPTYTEDSCKLADSGYDNDEIIESAEEDKFNYMMLDRLRTDCEYFLGYGNGSERNLWAGNVEDQIAEMRKIYDKLPEKPEWLSLEDIDKYEKDMLALKEQPMEEDLATLEVKIDQAQSHVQDIVDMIQDVKEGFDFDKAYNTIKLAEAEE